MKTTLKKILEAFAPCFQSSVTDEIAVIVNDAVSGKVPLPPIHLSGYAGLGKSFLLEKMTGLLETLAGFTKVDIPVGASNATLVTAVVQAPEKSVFIADESHTLKCVQILKMLTETGGKTKDLTLSLKGEEIPITVNPCNWLFVTASNESIKDTALVGQSGRFRNLKLRPYDMPARQALIKALAPVYSLPLPTDKAIELLSENVRPFARSIKNALVDLRNYSILNESPVKGTRDLKRALVDRGYFPLGFKTNHIENLRFLASDSKGKQVQDISNGPMQGADAKETSAILAELLQAGFVSTLASGRKGASAEAIAYLKRLGF